VCFGILQHIRIDLKVTRVVHLSLGIFLLTTSCGRRDVESIVIRGSDTEVNLVLRMAETYMDDDPDISVAVTGGGSGTGIASLINKRTDIANSSRAFTEEESKIAADRGVDVRPIVFAVDALCFIVNENQAVDGLTYSLANRKIGTLLGAMMLPYPYMGGRVTRGLSYSSNKIF